ncbi:MAG: VWA domain-containing protein [Archangiaceae bacterium]|nr:VWA domain-containing protein [Archangiaceae bacterium]
MKTLWLVFPLLALVACDRTKLKKVLPPNVRVDAYSQQAASRIDVLWVVDNSGSMAARQENLAKNFQAFIDVFQKSGIDFRIAVTTTDIFKEKGALVGTPKIITPTTANVASTFANNVRVGTNGSPYEAGLAAAQLALNLQARTNGPKLTARKTCTDACKVNSMQLECEEACFKTVPIDFLRPEAYLYLVFVTDEEDESSQDVRYFWRSFETTKGIGNDGTVTTAAIMGDTPTNTCGAGPGTRYKALSDLTGGEVGSICDTNFSATLRKLATNAVGLKRKFALAATPDLTTIKIAVKYPCNLADAELSRCATVDRAACEGEAADSVNLVCTPPAGPPDGWSYEMTSNSIFFEGESVPGVKGQIEIQYCPEGLTCGM